MYKYYNGGGRRDSVGSGAVFNPPSMSGSPGFGGISPSARRKISD